MSSHHDPASEFLAVASETHRPGVPAENDQDPLVDILQQFKLSGALFFLVDATSPWCVEVPEAARFADIILPRSRHVISYHVAVEGSGFASVPGLEPVAFEAGDVIVFPHADPYLMLSEPGVPPELDAAATLEFFRCMAAGELPFVVTEGGGQDPPAKFVCGFLGCDAQPFNPLLAALPRLLHVRRDGHAKGETLERLVELTLTEAQVQEPGGESIRLRLSELLFVEVVRRYLLNLPPNQTGWLAGLRDQTVGKSLALLHARPAEPWTLEDLARQSGVSRSILAERFTHFVGKPPMQYLTHWRIQLAARLLNDRDQKVASIANQVGYASEAAFSRAFKKIAGMPPSAWRQRSDR